MKEVIDGRNKVYHFPWKVSYYETDAMKIVHHSNYIRWMESARCAWLDWADMSFKWLEEQGITSPVLGVETSYKKPAFFADDVDIAVAMSRYDGLRFEYVYRITRDGELLCEGKSKHCFTNSEGRVLSLPRTRPDLHERIVAFLGDEGDHGTGEARTEDARTEGARREN